MFTYVRGMPCLPVIYYLSNITCNFLDNFDTAVNTYNYFLVHYLPSHNHELNNIFFFTFQCTRKLKKKSFYKLRCYDWLWLWFNGGLKYIHFSKICVNCISYFVKMNLCSGMNLYTLKCIDLPLPLKDHGTGKWHHIKQKV